MVHRLAKPFPTIDFEWQPVMLSNKARWSPVWGLLVGSSHLQRGVWWALSEDKIYTHWTCVCIYAHIYINDKCTHVCILRCLWFYVQLYHICVLLYIYIYVHIYICIYIHIYIYSIPIGSKFDRQSDDEPLNFRSNSFLMLDYDLASGHWEIWKVQ